MNSLERRLVFFRWESFEGSPPFDPARAALNVSHLPDDGSRKVKRGEFWTDVLINEVGELKKPTRLSLLRLRDYENRPWVRRPGDAPRPAQMRRDEDLVDFCQTVIWRDGYAAFAQGGHSPAPSALADFFERSVKELVFFRPLYQRDLVERIKTWRGVRSTWLEINNSAAVQGQVNANLGPFQGLWDQLVGQPAGIVFRQQIGVSPRGRGARSRVLPNVTPEDLIRLADLADVFDSLQVTGLTASGGIESLDLIHQRLQIVASLPRSKEGGHRTDDAATFERLIRARSELDSDGRLANAATASPQIHDGG